VPEYIFSLHYHLTVVSVPFTVRCNENVTLEPGMAILIDRKHFTIEVPLNLFIVYEFRRPHGLP